MDDLKTHMLGDRNMVLENKRQSMGSVLTRSALVSPLRTTDVEEHT